VSRCPSLLGIPATSDDSALDEPVQPVERRVRLSALLVRKDRRMAGQRKHERDFRPHHCRADDAHFVRQAQFIAPSVKTAAQEAARQSLIGNSWVVSGRRVRGGVPTAIEARAVAFGAGRRFEGNGRMRPGQRPYISAVAS
jgi:hypothetical protein